MEAEPREEHQMTHHIFNGKTITMIAKEHGVNRHSLYHLLITEGAPVKEALNFLAAHKALKSSKPKHRKGAR